MEFRRNALYCDWGIYGSVPAASVDSRKRQCR